jgi:hypothetical protein
LIAAVALPVAAACGNDETPVANTATRPDSSSGEVAQYALMKNSIGWLTDSNVVALATQLNSDALGIARLEAQTWSREPFRMLASSIIRDHARLQVAIDSVASLRRLPSQMPAVGPEMKAPYDSVLNTQVGLPLQEREGQFLDVLIKEHQRSIVDFSALAGNASDPELRAVLVNRAVLMEQTHVAQARMLGDAIARADSAREDSLKARAQRRARR